MKYIIDRFEGEYAVLECEDGKDKLVLKSLLPADSREGYVIEQIGDIFRIDYNDTEERRKKMQNRMKRFKK